MSQYSEGTDRAFSISELRERIGMEPHELAARLKVDVQEVRDWEAGTAVPNATQLTNLATELGVAKSQIKATGESP